MAKWYTDLADDFKTMLHSNEAIDKIANGKAIRPKTFVGALPVGFANTRRTGNQGFMKEMEDTHRTKDGNLNYAAIAGSFMVAGAGYRALSGGGVYRDANGNTDVAGIPFI